MTANSLGRTLIGVLGIWMLLDGALLLAQGLSGFLTIGMPTAMPGPVGTAMDLVLGGQLVLQPLLGVCLILLRTWLAEVLFGKDGKLEVETSMQALTALMLFGIGVWYLVDAIMNSLSFVEWGSNPDGFPFKFGNYPGRFVMTHVLEAAIALILVFRCGWIATRMGRGVKGE